MPTPAQAPPARKLTARDTRAMAIIHAESFAPPMGRGGWPALEMSAHVQKDMCLGLEKDGALAAFLILSVVADQAEILTIATAGSARRQGLARAMLVQVFPMLRARGITEFFLEVAEDNDAAIALYRYTGFVPVGRRPGYYRREKGRVAALTLSKKL